MISKLFGATLALSTFLILSASHDHTLCAGFVPENDMAIPVGAVNAMGETTGINEEQFHKVIDQVESHYSSIISGLGGVLDVERKWSDSTVNAYAKREGSTYKVAMFGGLARHARFTEDAFMIVVCHELGHHIGGAPKIKSFFGSSWASNEGQADYFGGLKCMRRVLQDQDNVAAISNIEVPPTVDQACAANFETENEYAICVRSSLAGRQLGRFFMDMRKLDEDPRFDSPDQTVVRRMDDKHPGHQCRLDTYFQGAHCNVDYNDDVSQTVATQATCNRVDGYEAGVRPLCWYKPAN